MMRLRSLLLAASRPQIQVNCKKKVCPLCLKNIGLVIRKEPCQRHLLLETNAERSAHDCLEQVYTKANLTRLVRKIGWHVLFRTCRAESFVWELRLASNA